MKRRSFRAAILIAALTLVCAAIALSVALANKPDSAPTGVSTSSTAQTQNPTGFTAIPCTDSFELFDAVASPDGTLVLSGFSGERTYGFRNTKATMIRCGLDGNLLWELFTGPEAGDVYDPNDYSYYYKGAMFTGENRIAAIRMGPGLDSDDMIDYIEDGRVESRASGLPQPVGGILVLPDGMLIEGNPDWNSQRIARLNEKGDILWQLMWPERMRFAGLATNGNVHVAYGCIDIQRPDGLSVPSESLIIAFDDDGRILWRRDIPSIAKFTDCVIEPGRIVLSGGTPGRENGVIAAFDIEGNELFRREYQNTDRDNMQTMTFSCIVATDYGYVACMNPWARGCQFCFMAVDREGEVICQWTQDIEQMHGSVRFDFVSVENNVYAVVNGEPKHDPLPEDDDGNIIGIGTIPNITAIMPIDLPIPEGQNG